MSGWGCSAAALLFGACDALRQDLGESPDGHRGIAAQVETSRRRAAEALGAGYEEQRSRGQAMPLSEAITSALLELGEQAVIRSVPVHCVSS